MLLGYFLTVLMSEALSANVLTAIVSGIVAYILTRLLFWGEYLVMIGKFKVGEMLLSVTLPEVAMTLPAIPLIFGLAALMTGSRRTDDSRSRRSRREAF
jgi:hypothetical protein